MLKHISMTVMHGLWRDNILVKLDVVYRLVYRAYVA
jgi:hypothetical protein